MEVQSLICYVVFLYFLHSHVGFIRKFRHNLRLPLAVKTKTTQLYALTLPSEKGCVLYFLYSLAFFLHFPSLFLVSMVSNVF